MPTSAPAEFDYRKGTIAVIEVWNFVTYSHMAIFPNSRLNLVIGPNGSGKSSIVCAMCLGLGGHLELDSDRAHGRVEDEHVLRMQALDLGGGTVDVGPMTIICGCR